MTNSFQNPLIASMVSHQSWLLSSTAQTSKSFLFKSIKSFLQQIEQIRQIHQYHHGSLIHQIRKNHTIFQFLNFFYRTLAKNQASDALHLRWTKTRGLVKKWASTEYLNAGSACLAFSLLSRKKELTTDLTYFY